MISRHAIRIVTPPRSQPGSVEVSLFLKGKRFDVDPSLRFMYLGKVFQKRKIITEREQRISKIIYV